MRKSMVIVGEWGTLPCGKQAHALVLVWTCVHALRRGDSRPKLMRGIWP